MMLRLVALISVAFFSLISCTISARKDFGDFKVTVLANASAVLPCLPTSEIEDSAAIIVLWYKNNNPEPFYSYDIRQNGGGRHWSDQSVFGQRVQFDSSDRPLKLRVSPTLAKDQGSYRCRVDYDSGPSRAAVIELIVIVLPTSLTITNEMGAEVESQIGPYLEGKGTILTCSAYGGRPPPAITWLKGNKVIETSYSADPRGVVRSLLHLQHLTRDLLGASFTCQAENTNMTNYLYKTVQINMTLSPLSVELKRKGGSVLYVREGKLEHLECVTFGSHPEPKLTWYWNTVMVYQRNITEHRTKNQTISTFPFVPKLSDHGTSITCRVSNPFLPESNLETSLKLNVHYSPKIKLLKGLQLNPTAVREGADFYFECVVSANPTAYKITWMQEGREIRHNVSARVIISNQTLVLQGVGRRSAGDYQCKAINLHGYGISNSLKLNVLYSPVCSSEEVTHIEVYHKATANITCSVDAQPRNATFKWQFNSSGGIIEIDSDRFNSRETSSVLPYTPASPGDYGLLLCFAQNEIGKQERPCVINVTAAEPPILIESCHIANQSSYTLLIICKEVDNTLKPNFKLEVQSLEDQSVVTFLQNKTARFVASGLTPGTAYVLSVIANSSLGMSKPIKLKAFTVKMAEKRMGVHQQQENGEMRFGSIISGVLSALIISISLITVAVIKLCPCKKESDHDSESHMSTFTQEDRMRFDIGWSESSVKLKEESSQGTDPGKCDVQLSHKQITKPSSCAGISSNVLEQFPPIDPGLSCLSDQLLNQPYHFSQDIPMFCNASSFYINPLKNSSHELPALCDPQINPCSQPAET